jgi:hypothetical protein
MKPLKKKKLNDYHKQSHQQLYNMLISLNEKHATSHDLTLYSNDTQQLWIYRKAQYMGVSI